MGINLGALAGGIAKGWSQGIEDRQRQEKAKRDQDQADREEADRKAYQQVLADVAARHQSRLEIKDQAGAQPGTPASYAAGGIGGLSGTSLVPQEKSTAGDYPESFVQRQATNPAAGGIQSATPPAKRYRDANTQDRFAHADDLFNSLVDKGLLKQAGEVAPFRAAFMQEKLHEETAKREGAARNLQFALNGGSDEQILNAVKGVSDLIPDGKHPTAMKRNTDGSFAVTYGDQTQNMTGEQMLQAAITLVDPKAALTYAQQQQQLALDRWRVQSTDTRENRRLAEDERHHKADEATDRTQAALRSGVTLSIPQRRINAEIDAARAYVSGMSPEEIQKKTQQYSATGRINDAFDPTLAAKVKQAQRRKFGEDEGFDLNSARPVDDLPGRFSADPQMRGYRLGRQTPQGFEVFDASGRLAGHYE